MSGGVDSSTAAALLKKQGYYLEGAIMKFEGVSDQDIASAQAAARCLDIPFRIIDLSTAYQELIIRPFVQEYAAGRTPNPCVFCNQYFKFGFFLQRALAFGFDLIATGHYVRRALERGVYRLRRGIDKNEQSYFLYRLNQRQISRALFPLGSLTKDEVRTIARQHGLPTAQRRKSHDVCFLPDADYASYLKKILPEKPGDIIDQQGRIIGRHQGVIFYTIGQRRRIGISRDRPYYVTAINASRNWIQVGDKSDVFKTTFLAGQVHFLQRPLTSRRQSILGQVRYNSPATPVRLTRAPGGLRVIFEKPQWAITPGQSVVFYRDDELLGGGIIKAILA